MLGSSVSAQRPAVGSDDSVHRAVAEQIEALLTWLHRIRKSAKQLRYTAAAADAKKVSDAAKTIQTLLGDHQDSVVSRAHLTEQATPRTPPGKTPSPTAYCISAKPASHTNASSNSTRR